MTIAEIQNNEELRRREFPIVREKVYLAHAGDSPLPRRVAEAVCRYAMSCCGADQEQVAYLEVLREGRTAAAQLIGSDPSEIAFVGPTSLGLSLVAGGLKFRRGDNVLIYFDDYPSNVYPWMALAGQGVQVRLMNTRGLGLLRTRDVLGQIDENTRLVALASCHFISGYRIDLPAIGSALRARGILFCVDGIQTLGAFQTSAQHMDFMAADAHKWLLGPCGAGLLYVRNEAEVLLTPQVHGWNNVRCPNYVAQEQIAFPPGAKKFEAGTHNLLGLVGLVEAMRLILELGVDAISADLLAKRAWLVLAVQARGYSVLQADAPAEHASGIVSLYRKGEDMGVLHRALLAKGFVTSLRTDRWGQGYLRVSPHFYVTMADLGRLVAAL